MKQFSVIIEKCPRCGEAHKFVIDWELSTPSTIYLLCPNITRLYRLTSFHFDAMPNILELEGDNSTRDYIKYIHGEVGIEDKFDRWKTIRSAHIWPIDEFNEYIEQVLQAYIQGLFFPAMTGACCLTERVMNRLVFNLKSHFKSSIHYKKVYNRNEKLQKWNLLIQILKDWEVFSKEHSNLAKKIHKYRTDSVHYVPEYDYKEKSMESIRLVSELIDSLFSVYKRKDIFYVFDIPGEIWVRSDAQNKPFVREFILPSCRLMSAIHQINEDGYSEDGAIVGKMDDLEFITKRREYQKNPDRFHDGNTPKKVEKDINGNNISFTIAQTIGILIIFISQLIMVIT